MYLKLITLTVMGLTFNVGLNAMKPKGPYLILSDHAMERMNKRGITAKQIAAAVMRGQEAEQDESHEDSPCTCFYRNKVNVICDTTTRTVVTVIKAINNNKLTHITKEHRRQLGLLRNVDNAPNKKKRASKQARQAAREAKNDALFGKYL